MDQQQADGGSKNDLRVETGVPVPQQARPSVSAATGKPLFYLYHIHFIKKIGVYS